MADRSDTTKAPAHGEWWVCREEEDGARLVAFYSSLGDRPRWELSGGVDFEAHWLIPIRKVSLSDSPTVEVPLSDVNDLDAVVHALGIEDSDTTPAEAVAKLQMRIRELEAAAEAADRCDREQMDHQQYQSTVSA